MAEPQCKFHIIPPDKAHLYESAAECTFPLSELKPSIDLTPDELMVLKAQLQKMQCDA